MSSNELPLETIQYDELIDCQVIELIRDDILTHAQSLPSPFIQKILNILNRGSIYSNTFASIDSASSNGGGLASSSSFLDLDSTRKLREEFSKTCFETLLRFSFVNGTAVTDSMTKTPSHQQHHHQPQHHQQQQHLNGDGTDTNLNKMALTSMLTRCKDIVQKYAHDEKLSGSVPLPRYLISSPKHFKYNSQE